MKKLKRKKKTYEKKKKIEEELRIHTWGCIMNFNQN